MSVAVTSVAAESECGAVGARATRVPYGVEVELAANGTVWRHTVAVAEVAAVVEALTTVLAPFAELDDEGND